MQHQTTDCFEGRLSIEEPWSAQRVDGLDPVALGGCVENRGTRAANGCDAMHHDAHLQSVQQQVQGMLLQQQQQQLSLKPQQQQQHLQREAALHWLYGGQSHPRASGQDVPYSHPDRRSRINPHISNSKRHIQGHQEWALKAEMEMLRHQNQSLLQQLCKVLTDSTAAKRENLKRRKVITDATAANPAAAATTAGRQQCADYLQTPGAAAAAAEVPPGPFVADRHVQQLQEQQQQQEIQQGVEAVAAVGSESGGAVYHADPAAAPATGRDAVASPHPAGASSMELDSQLDEPDHSQQQQQQCNIQHAQQQPRLHRLNPLGQQPNKQQPTRATTPRICLNLQDQSEPQQQQHVEAVSGCRHAYSAAAASTSTPGPERAVSEQPDAARPQRTAGLRLDLTDQHS